MNMALAAELFRQHGNISISHEDTEAFIAVLNAMKIKFKIAKADKPELVRFETTTKK